MCFKWKIYLLFPSLLSHPSPPPSHLHLPPPAWDPTETLIHHHPSLPAPQHFARLPSAGTPQCHSQHHCVRAEQSQRRLSVTTKETTGGRAKTKSCDYFLEDEWKRWKGWMEEDYCLHFSLRKKMKDVNKRNQITVWIMITINPAKYNGMGQRRCNYCAKPWFGQVNITAAMFPAPCCTVVPFSTSDPDALNTLCFHYMSRLS